MLKGFENKDPPGLKKLAVHPDLLDWLCKWVHSKGSSPQQQAVGDLEMIAFYYLLRVGEYTAPKQQGRQLRTFWMFWRAYCNPLGIDPYLEEVDFQTKTRVATGFEGRVRKGSHSCGKQVQFGTVHTALRGVKADIALDIG